MIHGVILALGLLILAFMCGFTYYISFRGITETVRPGRLNNVLLRIAARESINGLDTGLLFASATGIPILINQRMNELIHKILGHAVYNTETIWGELEDICEKTLSGREFLIVRFPEGQSEQTWRFRKQQITGESETVVQIEATDVTELESLRKNLTETNAELETQALRQRQILDNIVEINRGKEILRAKMRIHDELGRCIIMTKQMNQNRDFSSESGELLKQEWKNSLKNVREIPYTDVWETKSSENELTDAAKLIGCEICFDGPRPEEYENQLLYYSAVREALTNGVRHAGANKIFVKSIRTKEGLEVTISDNGTKEVRLVTEGEGLTNLRRKIESAGALLNVRCEDGVVLELKLWEGRKA